MATLNFDTIVAQATASGRGGVGIVRLSGPDAKGIAEKITQKKLKPRYVHFTQFYGSTDDIVDEGVVLFFKNPQSFTGEDVIELQGHGGPIVMQRLIQTAMHHGARMARAGEFSERAFLNKKIDLAQAEAIADLINASSEQAARSAVHSLQGAFSEKINHLQSLLTHLRMQVEAMIDFPEEEIDFLADDRVAKMLSEVIASVQSVKEQAKQGALLQDGLHVVIAGKPNAGKSSLLNYFTGQESAIVTDIPGTTRDVLRESVHLDGMPLHIIDTAGIRETSDVVEQEGVRRAYAYIDKADLVLLLIDAEKMKSETMLTEVLAFQKKLPENKSLVVIKNKIDLIHEKPKTFFIDDIPVIQLSIKADLGMALLKKQLKSWAGYQSLHENQFIARQRHVDAINRAYQYLLNGQKQLAAAKAGELLAEDLRQSQMALSEITGEFTSDDLLGVIFSSFCIGK